MVETYSLFQVVCQVFILASWTSDWIVIEEMFLAILGIKSENRQ